ncbi:hypothetical protein J40TS1_37360 [Paenibacillus montaniterrae]|uniref:Uncharacterized protein n=2 Tax=Paenibacillus montaniterrae TaxID=429341 RepID=A0A919YTZ5_9BACL|nr:hypothetical protein J40TS1_37360 [Paenibacillus montaniterrae]
MEYAILINPYPGQSTTEDSTPIPLVTQNNLGDFVTWTDSITVESNTYYKYFQLKSGYYYSIFYRALVRNDSTDPGIEITQNDSPLFDSQISSPAVAGKPVLLNNTIVIQSSNDNDKYALAMSYTGTTASSQGLGSRTPLDPASITIVVLGSA